MKVVVRVDSDERESMWIDNVLGTILTTAMKTEVAVRGCFYEDMPDETTLAASAGTGYWENAGIILVTVQMGMDQALFEDVIWKAYNLWPRAHIVLDMPGNLVTMWPETTKIPQDPRVRIFSAYPPDKTPTNPAEFAKHVASLAGMQSEFELLLEFLVGLLKAQPLIIIHNN